MHSAPCRAIRRPLDSAARLADLLVEFQEDIAHLAGRFAHLDEDVRQVAQHGGVDESRKRDGQVGQDVDQREPEEAAIERLGILKADPEPLEEGVPHPATYVLDREGRIRFVDVREDFHIWIDSEVLVEALAEIP